jgi:aryl-alcohol dehydrogenase-like predicted oxidoreductase
MIYRELGRTSERVSAIGTGGYTLENSRTPTRASVWSALRLTVASPLWITAGIISEVRMGQALREGYRQKVLLMTKIDGRDKNTAARQIEQSLGRLQTDAIDLLQFMRSFASMIRM